MEQRELVIIGAGPAGLTAAVYGKRAGLDVLVLEKGKAGGQILITSEIENWPGTISASGVGLADSFRAHAEHFKAEFRTATVKELRPAGGRTVVVTDQGEIEAKALIIATGANFRKQGCPGEKEFTGKGVSYCATCDGAFYKDKTVAVIGGGDTAAGDAVFLSAMCKKVYLIHRRDRLRASKSYEKKLDKPNIEIVFDTVTDELLEKDGKVGGLRLRNVKTDEVCEIAVNGVFVAVGNVPATDFVRDILDLDENGYFMAGESTKTNVPGVFAAGDCRKKTLRQIVTAAADGAVAAHGVEEYLS